MDTMRWNHGIGSKMKLSRVYRARQRGAVMIVSLMLLLVMTILAVSGVGNSVLEQRMSGNYYHAATAFQSAEYGLQMAEQWLNDNVNSAPNITDWFVASGLMNGLYTTQILASPNAVEVCLGNINCLFDPRVEANWCAGGAGCSLPKGFVTLGDNLHGQVVPTLGSPVVGDPQNMVPRQPQFVIEYLGQAWGPGASPSLEVDSRELPPNAAFRITVIGWGKDASTRHVIESHVLKRIPL